MGKATIDDVAELAGVSIKTVSRVANNEPNVRESTREKVEMAVAQLNYRPNLSARNLASHRSHQVVLVYDDPSAYETPSSGYIIRMQKGTLKACKQADVERNLQADKDDEGRRRDAHRPGKRRRNAGKAPAKQGDGEAECGIAGEPASVVSQRERQVLAEPCGRRLHHEQPGDTRAHAQAMGTAEQAGQ